MTIACGIIAAGDGLRLAAAKPGLPKPLTLIAGAPLCRWVVDSLTQAGIADVAILLNSRGRAVRAFLEKEFPRLSWDFHEKDTPSSWESFRLMAQALARAREDFLITTIDALVLPAEVSRFVSAARGSGAPAALALTEFVDDEKPLWADLSTEGLVRALGPDAKSRRYATAGLYYLTAPLGLGLAHAGSYGSLREFLTDLARKGSRIAGVPISKSVDVDRPQDIAVAEDFLRQTRALP